MGCFEDWSDLMFKWEGGYVNDPVDMGGATNRGITLTTYLGLAREAGLPATETAHRNLTTEQARKIARLFWDKVHGDELDCGIAIFLTDWYWGSGGYGIQRAQRVLGVAADGAVGAQTVLAANKKSATELLNALYKARTQHFYDIVAANRSQNRFLTGWINRNNSVYNLAVANVGKKKAQPHT